jgi:hypothetical protein
MYNIVLKLGMISAVDPQNKTLNIIDLSSGNLTSENYQNIYYPGTLAHQEIPKKGYYLLFAVLSSIPNRQDMIIPIKYFASSLEGDVDGSPKNTLAVALQEEGDQVLSSGVSTLLLQSMIASLSSGSQSIELNCDGSKMTIEYNSLEITGSDGFKITQEQDSNKFVIAKDKTTITLEGDKITISTGEEVNINAKNVNVASDENVKISAKNIILGDENTVKGQSLLQWLNTHTHPCSDGATAGPTTTPAQNTLLVKEQ